MSNFFIEKLITFLFDWFLLKKGIILGKLKNFQLNLEKLNVQGKNCLVWQANTFYEQKIVQTLADQSQSVVLNNKRLHSEEEKKTFVFLAFCLLIFECKKEFPKVLLSINAIHLRNCWFGLECEKFSPSFWKRQIWLARQLIWIFNLAFSVEQTCVARKQREELIFLHLPTSFRKVNCTVMIEKQFLVSVICRLVFREKSDFFQFLSKLVRSVSDAMTFSRDVISKGQSPARKVLVGTTRNAIARVVLEINESVYWNDSIKHPLIDNSGASGSAFQEQNTTLESPLALYK